MSVQNIINGMLLQYSYFIVILRECKNCHHTNRMFFKINYIEKKVCTTKYPLKKYGQYFIINNIKKKTPEEFHIFVILYSFTGIQTDLPTEFLPNPNRDVNHYATEHLQIRGILLSL